MKKCHEQSSVRKNRSEGVQYAISLRKIERALRQEGMEVPPGLYVEDAVDHLPIDITKDQILRSAKLSQIRGEAEKKRMLCLHCPVQEHLNETFPECKSVVSRNIAYLIHPTTKDLRTRAVRYLVVGLLRKQLDRYDYLFSREKPVDIQLVADSFEPNLYELKRPSPFQRLDHPRRKFKKGKPRGSYRARGMKASSNRSPL